MNYEELYENLQPLEKKLKDIAAAAQKLTKAIAKDTEAGDLKSLQKNLGLLVDIVKAQKETTDAVQALTEGFDSKKYMENGDFTAQMLASCKEQGVDVTGEFPVFEIFPYRLRFDTENQDLYLDRKKLSCMRPQSLVASIKSGQDRLMKAPFNAQAFVNELSDAYDLALLKLKKQDGADLYLTSLYKFLVPMGRFRRDYDQQSYAYDLARLYMSETETTKTGRRFQFGPSRNNAKAIRILDSEGHEQFLATIRFF